MLRISANVREFGNITLPISTLEVAERQHMKVLDDIRQRRLLGGKVRVVSTNKHIDTKLIESALEGLTVDEVNDFAWMMSAAYDPDQAEAEFMDVLGHNPYLYPLELAEFVT